MSIVDDGAGRADLAARREMKYVFRQPDVAALRRILQLSCRPIRYAGPVSTVRSVYFDDAVLSNCRANFDGVGLRHKVRLRWYDHVRPADHFFYEVKWRRHRVCGKHRLQIGCATSTTTLPFERTRDALARILPPRYGVHLAREAHAVVLVEYRREHFVQRQSGARFTLDYDLRFYPQLGHRRLSHRFAMRLTDIALIECKSGVGQRHALHGVLSPLRTRPARFSKYVIGCQLLGYVADQ